MALREPFRCELIGREAECAAIVNALEEEPARSVVFAGPAGVGRTRLAHEALALADGSGRPTRWAAATAAAARVPLGALAHLLPPLDATADPLTLLQRAMHALTHDQSEQFPVLGVDDVHLLDQLSVTLLHQLAASGVVTLVLTVRTGRSVADPVAALWKDGWATRIELPPLRRPDADGLISQVLGGDVDTRTCERLWRLSLGSPLYLRELLDEGLRSRLLRCSDGLWRWEGAMIPSQRLTEIVLTQLGELDADEWRALEALAAGEPIGVDHVIALSTPAAVASLERRGVITDDVGGRPGEVRAAHPLYTAVVRGRAPGAALRAMRRQVTDSHLPPRSHDELLRRSAVLLDGELPSPDAQLLTQTARHANAMLDHPLAERLARAGIEAGAGPQAHVALVEATHWQGDATTSHRLAIEAASVTITDDDRARLTATRALVLVCGLGRMAEAEAVLREALVEVRSDEGRALLAATEAVLALLGGDPERAVQRATSVLTSDHGGGSAQPLAAAAAAAGLAVTGHPELALDIVRAGWAAQESMSEGVELAFARVALAQAEVMALSFGGWIRELEWRTAQLHERNLSCPEWAGDAVACLYRGWAALATGRPMWAIRWLGEAMAGLQRRDPAGMFSLCSSLLALAKLLAGDAQGAREVLTGPVQQPGISLFVPVRRLAEAWLAAAEDRTADARALALAAAAEAAEHRQPAVEAVMLHGALRLGAPRDLEGRLRELADALDSRLVAVLAAHAEASVARDGGRLDLVSRQFEDVGQLFLAADTAAEAAAAHERVGDRRARAVSMTRAAARARECGMADTPTRDHLAPLKLTSREAEVAALAAGGLGNQAIASRLVLSVRTVEAHLAHTYTKLGISNRSALATALEPDDPGRAR